MSETDLSAWGVKAEEVTTLEEMDSLIQKLFNKREEHKAKKEEASKVYAELEEIEQLVMNALASNNRTKYELEGVASVYISHKEVWSTPKDLDKKRELFDYITNKYGKDSLDSMVSINHQTLNSWANQEVEGKADPTLPGIGLPSTVKTLNMRKK